MIVSLGKASLKELKTFYSIEDVHDMIEVAMVDAHNRRLLEENRQKDE